MVVYYQIAGKKVGSHVVRHPSTRPETMPRSLPELSDFRDESTAN